MKNLLFLIALTLSAASVAQDSMRISGITWDTTEASRIAWIPAEPDYAKMEERGTAFVIYATNAGPVMAEQLDWVANWTECSNCQIVSFRSPRETAQREYIGLPENAEVLFVLRDESQSVERLNKPAADE